MRYINKSFLVALTLSTMSTSSMANDEKANWKNIVIAMPLTSYQIVGSKYLLSCLFGVGSMIIVLIIGLAISLIIPQIVTSINLVIIYCVISFFIGTLYNDIMIPATYKFGTAKSRMVLFAFALCPTLILFILQSLGIVIRVEDFVNSLNTIIVISILTVVILTFFSFCISVRIHKKLH